MVCVHWLLPVPSIRCVLITVLTLQCIEVTTFGVFIVSMIICATNLRFSRVSRDCTDRLNDLTRVGKTTFSDYDYLGVLVEIAASAISVIFG